MARCCLISLVAAASLLGASCASLSTVQPNTLAATPPVESGGKENCSAGADNQPKKLLEWTTNRKHEEKEGTANGEPTGTESGSATGKKDDGKSDAGEPESTEEKRLDPDRPHLPESSTTVGMGRTMLEAGYTFDAKGSSFRSQTYPEAILRIGMLADWFELRIGESVISQRNSKSALNSQNENGVQDLYLGIKLALTEQQKYLPESALVLQMTVPTGARSTSADQVLPGVNYDASWEIVKDRAGIEIVLSANGLKDDVHHTYVNLASGVTGLYNLTRKLEAFAEWDALYPAAAVGPLTGPQHYAVGGLVYYLNDNFEVDIRAGAGLNEHANDLIAGAGFSVRY
jgi:hypothetical protein